MIFEKLSIGQGDDYATGCLLDCLTAGALATDAAILKKMFGSDSITTVISNEEMNDIMKIIKSWRIWFIYKRR